MHGTEGSIWLTYVLTPYLKGKTHGVPATTLPELNLPSVHHRGVVDTAAAPTQSNTQAAVNNLSKKGRTACRREVVGILGGIGRPEGREGRTVPERNPLAIILILI